MSDWSFWLPLIAAGIGVSLSAWMAGCRITQPLAAWSLHVGTWLVVYATWILLLGRPVSAATITLALWLTVVVVDRAKRCTLREPFVLQDFEYFLDVVRHPRLYIPFLGWTKFFIAAAAFIAAITVGWLVEAVPQPRGGQGAVIGLLYALGIALLVWGHTRRLALSYDPALDISRLGLTACLWRYAQEARHPLPPVAKFAPMTDFRALPVLPHLVAVQSESFFDARTLYPGIRQGALATFDAMTARSLAHGPLRVPAWGANTVRSEFSFLSGENLGVLGVHRFQPYWAVKRGLSVTALPEYLRRLGYRTIAVHPYPASFYRRDAVFPRLGFDRFLDLSSFTSAARFGPFVSDVAVADVVENLLRTATEPTFVFVITMENHGPLHLERVTNDDITQLYNQPPPAGCDDLTVYLRHLCNADRMLDRLQHALITLPRPASICWYGDHVPIMPEVYKTLGVPSGETSYLIWRNNQQADNIPAHPLAIQDLASVWLKHQIS